MVKLKGTSEGQRATGPINSNVVSSSSTSQKISKTQVIFFRGGRNGSAKASEVTQQGQQTQVPLGVRVDGNGPNGP